MLYGIALRSYEVKKLKDFTKQDVFTCYGGECIKSKVDFRLNEDEYNNFASMEELIDAEDIEWLLVSLSEKRINEVVVEAFKGETEEEEAEIFPIDISFMRNKGYMELVGEIENAIRNIKLTIACNSGWCTDAEMYATLMSPRARLEGLCTALKLFTGVEVLIEEEGNRYTLRLDIEGLRIEREVK